MAPPAAGKVEPKKAKKKVRLTKNQKRRLKKKENKALLKAELERKAEEPESKRDLAPEPMDEDKVEVEYISSKVNLDDPILEEFQDIFSKFTSAEILCADEATLKAQEEARKAKEAAEAAEKEVVAPGTELVEEEAPKPVMSRKARRKASRLSVAALKQLVARPDVVEVHDVTAADPRLLVYLKSYRNTVPVPRHWCQKRKYLQGKRGVERPPFELPDFIANTGIGMLRSAVSEVEDVKSLKSKTRERVQPKMGKIDIDYQVLHDAFFRYQTKPFLTTHGDVYYEGKEFEAKLRTRHPGHVSDQLRLALGMPSNAPPPWLINMQRYGPPPSYPNLRIPGLNAPIPKGASFGYHPGGWGKPPVDETGRPLYGDVFGLAEEEEEEKAAASIDQSLWGELGEEDEDESESESESEEEEEEAPAAPDAAAAGGAGVATPMPAGLLSVASAATGLDTPQSIDLRKQRRGMETPETPAPLYQVLEQKETAVGSGLYGASHQYVVPKAGGGGGEMSAAAAAAAKAAGKAGVALSGESGVTVSLAPGELAGLSEHELKARYEDEMEAQQSRTADQLSNVIAEEQRKRKRKQPGGSSSSKSKRSKDSYKNFKF